MKISVTSVLAVAALSLGTAGAVHFADPETTTRDPVIVAAYKTHDPFDHTPDQLAYEGKCLVKSFQALGFEDGLELESASFEKETQQSIGDGDLDMLDLEKLGKSWGHEGSKSDWDYRPGWACFDDDRLQCIFLNLGKYSSAWGCTRGQYCPRLNALAVQAMILNATAVSGKPTHQDWEESFCECLGQKQAFDSASECKIFVKSKKEADDMFLAIESAQAAPTEPSASTAVTTTATTANAAIEATTTLAQPEATTRDSTILAAYKTDSDDHHTPEALEYEGKCLVKSFEVTDFDEALQLESATFEKEAHTPIDGDVDSAMLDLEKLGKSWGHEGSKSDWDYRPGWACFDDDRLQCIFLNLGKYSSAWGCTRGHYCPRLSALAVQTMIAPTVGVRGGKKHASHALWEENFCECLGQNEAFATVSDCKIFVKPTKEADNLFNSIA